MRKLITFPCEGETLAGTLDEGTGTAGLLIVSGGNEVRVGAHRGMALLAQRLAASGIPVFRFDRRGIGDSTGENRGFRASGPDIAAALAVFRRQQPQLARTVGFGSCDAATALAMFGGDAGLDALVLANPWVVEPDDDLPPAAAIRARYARRLSSPAAYWRFLSQGGSWTKLARGVAKAAVGDGDPPLARVFNAALRDPTRSTSIILASGDATAIAFRAAVDLTGLSPVVIETNSHSFARVQDAEALEREIRRVLG